jgi:hypothetical protein
LGSLTCTGAPAIPINASATHAVWSPIGAQLRVPLSGQSLDPEAQLAKVLQPAMTLETEVPVGSVHRWQRRMAALLFLDLIPDRLDSAPFRSFNNLPNVNLLFALSIRLPLERKHWCSKGSRSMAKRRVAVGGTMTGSALSALDDMEPELRHLAGLITALRILGEADALSRLRSPRLRDAAARQLKSSSETGGWLSAPYESADCGKPVQLSTGLRLRTTRCCLSETRPRMNWLQ